MILDNKKIKEIKKTIREQEELLKNNELLVSIHEKLAFFKETFDRDSLINISAYVEGSTRTISSDAYTVISVMSGQRNGNYVDWGFNDFYEKDFNPAFPRGVVANETRYAFNNNEEGYEKFLKLILKDNYEKFISLTLNEELIDQNTKERKFKI